MSSEYEPSDPVLAQRLARVLQAARGPALPGEIAGEQAARAAFQASLAAPTVLVTPAAVPTPIGAHSRPLRRKSMLSTLLASKVLAAAAGLVTVVGTAGAAAAYTGSLPASWQTVAHNAIGAPSPHGSSTGTDASATTSSATGAPVAPTSSPTPSDTPTSTATPTDTPTSTATPSSTSLVGAANALHGMVGLCNAYAHVSVHGQATAHSQAFAALITAAGGASNVTTFCAQATAAPTPTPTSTATSTSTSGGSLNTMPTSQATGTSTDGSGRSSAPGNSGSHRPASSTGHGQ
ncbi:MAG: hypothetical protein ACYCXA_02680 [Actinomycetes bacterium]